MVFIELVANGRIVISDMNNRKVSEVENSLSDTHSSSDGYVESSELLVLVEDGDVTEIVTVDVDIVGRRNSDSDLELSRLLCICARHRQSA